MSDAYTHYRRNLAGEPVKFVENEPQPGRYRTERGGKWVPVAIWTDADGQMNALIGERPVAPESIWVSCCRYPVTEAAYNQAMDNGTWPDDLPVGKGHNQPANGDPYAVLSSELHDAVSTARAWLKSLKDGIKKKEDADKAHGTSRELAALVGRIEAQRKTEKAPHFEAGKKIDAKYGELKDKGQEVVSLLKKALTPYLKELERQAEEQRKAAAEAAAKVAAESGADIPIAEVSIEASKVGGQYRVDGRRRSASLVTVIGAKITDPGKCAEHFSKHADMKELLVKLATQQFRADNDAVIPGAEITKTQEAR